jgi:hypothetical protein
MVKLHHPYHVIVQHVTHLAPHMTDDISGMGKTKTNASLICKNNLSKKIILLFLKANK